MKKEAADLCSNWISKIMYCVNKRKRGDVEFFVFNNLENTGIIKHCFSTRKGGISTGYFSSLNLGYGRGDDDANVDENYRRICEAASLTQENIIMAKQRHGTNIYKIEEKREIPDNTDGLMTNKSGIVLATYYADCVPLLFCDPVKRVIANSHAGWRGSVQNMAAKTVKEMSVHYGCDPKDILAGIGPCISGANFEVDEDVAVQFEKEFSECVFPVNDRPGKFRINLQEACKLSLLRSFVPEENIEITNCCTYSDEELFFSHRRNREERGSLAAFIELA